MKMINGQLPTWYVIKRISEDPEMYAKAPETSELYAAKAKYDLGDVALLLCRSGEWREFEPGVTTRNDWTLYRRGKKKQKASGGEIALGSVHYDSLHAHLMGYSSVSSELAALVGDYNIIAIPVKS